MRPTPASQAVSKKQKNATESCFEYSSGVRSLLVAHHVGCHGGRFPACNLGGNQGIVFPPGISSPLRTDWQRHVLASSGYLELGMLDDAALALEEITPEDKTRTEVLGAREVAKELKHEGWYAWASTRSAHQGSHHCLRHSKRC